MSFTGYLSRQFIAMFSDTLFSIGDITFNFFDLLVLVFFLFIVFFFIRFVVLFIRFEIEDRRDLKARFKDVPPSE